MKLLLEIEIKDLKFKPEWTKEQIIKSLQRKVDNINDLMINSILDNSKFPIDDPEHPMCIFEANLKVIDYEN